MNKSGSPVVMQDHRLVDRITYLASLASSSQAIESLLDPLREVTAGWGGDNPLPDADRRSLEGLEGDLKNYLITKDPVRSFSAEELESRIVTQEARQSGVGFLNKYVLAVLISFVAAGIAHLLASGLSFELRNLIFVSVQMWAAQIITVWFYISNLDNFKKEFRQAFVFISLGVLPVGVLFGQIALVQIFGIGDQQPFRYAGMTYFAALTFFVMYIGFRKYAQLLHINTWMISWPKVLAIAGVYTAITVMVPHASVPGSEFFFDLSMGGMAVGIEFAALNAFLIGKIKKVVTESYRKPLWVMHIYMYMCVFGMALATVALYFLGELKGDSLTLVILLAAIPQQLFLLYSGYSFQKYTSQ